MLPDAHSARISEKGGVERWIDPSQSLNWYGKFDRAGAVEAQVVVHLQEGRSPTFRLTVGETRREVQAKAPEDGSPLSIDFGSYDIDRPGFHVFRLEQIPAVTPARFSVDALVLDGPACEKAHFNRKERRNAASVHLMYTVPKDMEIAAFHCEVTALEDPTTTFYMACGWHRGYFGMQVNSPSERRIIFSVWDSGNEASDRNKVAQDNRATLVKKGPGVFSGDFGNEGTGGHSHLKYPWKTGTPQRFVVTSQPVESTYTIYSGYWFHPDQNDWMLISSWKAPRDGGWLKRPHSFSENFGGNNGHLLRKARFGQQWIRRPDGSWIECTKATFSHDPTGRQDRLDRYMGIEDGQFFLSHGGFVEGYSPFGAPFERPAAGPPPEVRLPQNSDDLP
jgi:hypothetical protein